MTVLRRWLPPSPLGKARLTGAFFAVASLAAQLGTMGNPARTPAWHIMSAVAVLVAVSVIVTTYVRGRVHPLEAVGVPGLVFVAGTGLEDSVATFGLCIAVAVAQSMYGSVRVWALRSVLLSAAFLGAIAVSPYSIGGQRVSWHEPSLLVMAPQAAMLCVLVRGLYLSLLHQHQAGERDVTLAHTGSRLIALTDLDQVRSISAEAAARLSQQSPGTVTVMLARGPRGLTVIHGVGIRDAVVGTVLPADSVSGLDATDNDTVRTLTGGLEMLQAHAPGIRHWRGVGLAADGADRYLLVGGVRPVSDDVVNAFRNLANQVAFAEGNCRAHEGLDYRANHDNLTTLPNRGQFHKRLTSAIDEQVPASVLVIDLDDFKRVNDAHGHQTGDELLVEVAARLVEVGGPNGVAARFGGDEFALLLTASRDDVDATAKRLCARLMEPMRLNAATVTVGASVGVATATAGMTGGDLMRCADIAMYSAKALGKNRVERFTAERHGDIAQHRLLEEHLTNAIERDELVAHYQPYVDLRTGECIGVEAVPRWQHPTLGLLPAEDFIPIAERTGQIAGVGAHILQTACRQLSAWPTVPGSLELRLLVDVATPQLLDPRFATTLRQVLAETGLSAERLYLKILESEQLYEPAARRQLHDLAETGIRITLDNTTAGNASLATLRALPIHQLKVEISSVTHSTDRVHADDMLRLIASIGAILNLETLAEGVETDEQADRLRATNIAHAQGSLYADPMPAHELVDWLTRHRAPREMASGRPVTTRPGPGRE